MVLPIFCYLLCLVWKVAEAASFAPSWVASPMVQADQYNLINNVRTGNTSTPTATMTFRNTFTTYPNLAYGIINYEANDAMGSQCWEILKTALSVSSFSVKVQIKGYTNLWMLTVRYFAIQSSFPHHLNSFDNVPVNYSRGPITNISTKNSVIRYYANTINYTKQAASYGYSYKTFTPPYSNYKILLFMTSMFEFGTNQQSGETVNRPLDLRVSAVVKSSSTYMINASYGIQAKIVRLHYSMIIFDQSNVEASGQYILVYQRVDWGNNGAFYRFPTQFDNNFIIGYVQFSSYKTRASCHFKIIFLTIWGIHGVYIYPSTPRYNVPFTRFGFNIFYMKTWVCPPDTFFNKTNDMCETCAIPNCAVCDHISLCKTCITSYKLNAKASPENQCIYCPVNNCLVCATGNTSCLQCDSANNYMLNAANLCQVCAIPNCAQCLALDQCLVCDEENGYFINPFYVTALPPTTNTSNSSNISLYTTDINEACVLCSIPHCLKCANLSVCQICDDQSGFYFNDLFVNDSDQCIPCNIPNCLQCLSLSQCTKCNQTAGYMLNSFAAPLDQCIVCQIPHCVSCLSPTTCLECDQLESYFLSPYSPTNISLQCIPCQVPNCMQCQSITSCLLCNQTNNYFLNPNLTNTTTNLSLICLPCQVANCVTCLNLTSCLECDYLNNYFLNPNYTRNYTQNPFGEMNIYNTSNLTNSSLNTSIISDSCVQCSLAQCLQCSNLTACLTCNESNNYFINYTDNLCYFCEIDQCVVCLTLTVCWLCNYSNTNYVNSIGLCHVPIHECGNSIVLNDEQCDDGNTISTDGCSSTCKIEDGFICEPNPVFATFDSLCYYVGEITIKVIYIEKVDYQNSVQILLQIGPTGMVFWNDVNFNSIIDLSNVPGFTQTEVVRNADGTVSIWIDYNQDIHKENLTLYIDPTQSGSKILSRQNVTNVNFLIIPTDNQPAVFYQQQTYNQYKKTNILVSVVSGLAMLVFFIGIFSGRLVGVEMMAVIQIVHLSVIFLQNVNLGFNALTNVWFVNGFNYFILNKIFHWDSNIPIKAKGINISSQFLYNYNLTQLLIFLPCIIAAVSYLIFKLSQKQDIKEKALRISRKSGCEYAYNGVMFSGYIIFISVVMFFVYGTTYIKGLAGLGVFLMIIALTIFLMYFVLIIKLPEYFGEFSYFFRADLKFPDESQDHQRNQQAKMKQITIGQSINKKWWYNILMLQRIMSGTILVLLINTKFGPLVFILLYTFFGLYTLVRRPYLKLLHNLRFVSNMCIVVVIEAVFLVYNLSDFQIRNKTVMWLKIMPIVVCVLLLVCIIYSAVILVYQLVKGRDQDEYKKTLEKQEQEVDNYFAKQAEKALKTTKNLNQPLQNSISKTTKNSKIVHSSSQSQPESPKSLKKSIDDFPSKQKLRQVRQQLQQQFSKNRPKLPKLKVNREQSPGRMQEQQSVHLESSSLGFHRDTNMNMHTNTLLITERNQPLSPNRKEIKTLTKTQIEEEAAQYNQI